MASSWIITGDVPDQIQFTGATPISAHYITFRTGNGNAGSVYVPDSEYTPARVKAIIQAKANVVDEVNALSAGSVPAL